MTNLDFHVGEVAFQKSRNRLVKILARTHFSEDELYVEPLYTSPNNRWPGFYPFISDIEKLTPLDSLLLLGIKNV